MKRTLMILSIISGLLVSCEDEERDPFPFEKQTELLAGKQGESKTWLLESLHVNGSLAPIDDCDKDNVHTFYNDDLQRYTITSGAQKCDGTDPELLEEGSWMFTTAGKTMIISGSKIFKYKQMSYFALITSKTGKIMELTETSFKIDINIVDGETPESANVIISLKAK